MKKRNIFLSILVVLLLFTLTGCGKKNVATGEDFKSLFEEKGYTIYDVTSQFSSLGVIESATIAQSNNGYQVEFYVLKDQGEAVAMFNTNSATFETYKGNTSSGTTSSANNYSTYSLTSSGYYMYLCQVDNTLLYVKIPDAYKNEVKKVVKQFGY